MSILKGGLLISNPGNQILMRVNPPGAIVMMPRLMMLMGWKEKILPHSHHVNLQILWMPMVLRKGFLPRRLRSIHPSRESLDAGSVPGRARFSKNNREKLKKKRVGQDLFSARESP